MKIAITADLQFDEYRRLSTLHPSGVTTRLKDMLDCFGWMVDIALGERCEGLFIIGDVFESRTSIDLTVLDQVCRQVQSAANEMKVVALVGNHDSALRTPNINSLQVFGGMATVIEELTVMKPFAFVPWNDDPDIIKRDVARAAKSGASYLLSHALVEGAVPKGRGLPPADLKPKSWKRVILGDVHEPIFISPNIQYVGAPMMIDYRDVHGRRGFWILDTKKDTLRFVENTVSPKFHLIVEPEDGLETNIGARDFVRVQVEDPAEAAKIVADLRETTPWVESTVIETDDDDPRLDVRVQDDDDPVLRKYVEYNEFEGGAADELVALGLNLLAEARV